MQPSSTTAEATHDTLTVPARERRRSRAALLAWSLCALSWTLLLGTLVLASASVYARAGGGALLPAYVALVSGPNQPLLYGIEALLGGLSCVAFASLGALIVARFPRHAIGWIFCLLGLFGIGEQFCKYYAVYGLLARPSALGGALVAAWVTEWSWTVFFGLLCVFLPLLFPTGRVLSPRWRPILWSAVLSNVLLTLCFALKPGPFGNAGVLAQFDSPVTLFAPGSRIFSIISLAFGALLLHMLLAAVSVVVRLRRTRGDERQQLIWFCYPSALLAILFVFQGMFRYVVPIWTPLLELGYGLAYALTFLTLPLAAGVAILRYRLYELDLVVNRTLVYGGLTASIVGIYVLVVGVLGAMLQTRGNLAVSLIATGVVALLVHPLQLRLQRGANRLMYGERDEPYTVISRLGQRLEGTLTPDAVLPTIVETVRDALKLPYAAIALDQDGSCTMAASSGQPVADTVVLPLLHQGAIIGRLILGPRAVGEQFSSADRRLLDDLTHQAGVAAQAVRLHFDGVQLAADLQRTREHLVSAREEERRRLRRDLHDGLGPRLASQTMKLEAARDLIATQPRRAEALLDELIAQSQTAVADIRRLVYALRPPALDEFGLLSALREHAAQHVPAGIHVSLDAPDELPALSAAVEVAAYRIVQEALTNIVKHAHAHSCSIRIGVESGGLALEVADDGRGLPAQHHSGVGMSSMRERAEELGGTCTVMQRPGGGTIVRARLPIDS